MYNKASDILRKALCVLFSVVFVALAAFYPNSFLPTASAQQSLEELKDEYASLEKEIEKNEKKLAAIQSDISANEDKLTAITGQIETIKSQISNLDSRIEVLNADIDELQPKIDELSVEIAGIEATISELNSQIDAANLQAGETKNSLLERIREDYMTGGNASMLEVLLTAEDLTSFLSRMELIDRVTENDAELIRSLEEQARQLKELEEAAQHSKAELQLKKAKLDSQMDTLAADQDDLQDSINAATSKKSDLTGKYSQVTNLLSKLDKDSAAYKAEIKRQYEEQEALSAEIDNYIEKNGSSLGDKPTTFTNDGDLMWPVPYDNCVVTCHYGRYSDGSPHWGTDITVRDSNGSNVSNGKDIVAAQSGEVIIAYNDGNYNSGYGNYCVIDHGDGMMTLYCHCKRLTVSKGEIVKKGEKIAEIGLTGNTTGYHLHFEVRIKNSDGTVKRVDAENYVSCP